MLTHRYFRSLSFLAFVACGAQFSLAQNESGNEQLRKEIEDLKKQQVEMQQKFDKRIEELEKKLQQKPAASQNPIKVEGLIQSRADFDSGAADSFYFRRLELKFSGGLSPRLTWFVMIDPAKELKLNGAGNSINQATKILQDAVVNWSLGNQFSLDIGQKRIPLGLEALTPTPLIDLTERALFMSQGKLADQRDIGLQLNGGFGDFKTTLAMTNGLGESQNSKDSNDQKSFGGRVTWEPHQVSGLHLGASGMSGTSPNGQVADRLGAEFRYRNHGWTLQGEVMAGLNDSIRSQGAYAHLGYQIDPKLEAMARLDGYDPNRTVDSDHVTDFILGLNYYLTDRTNKLQFNWINRKFGNGSSRMMWNFGLQIKW